MRMEFLDTNGKRGFPCIFIYEDNIHVKPHKSIVRSNKHQNGTSSLRLDSPLRMRPPDLLAHRILLPHPTSSPPQQRLRSHQHTPPPPLPPPNVSPHKPNNRPQNLAPNPHPLPRNNSLQLGTLPRNDPIRPHRRLHHRRQKARRRAARKEIRRQIR